MFFYFVISLSVAFKQESAPLAEKETLPGSTSGQDGEPDRQPGAHGEGSQGPTERQADRRRHDSETNSAFCSLQVQDLEFAQIERKVIDGLKVGNECLKKMHEVRRSNLPTAAPRHLSVSPVIDDCLFHVR